MLKCYAFLTYPAPRISWTQGNTSVQETDQEETRDGVLYSLRSDQNIINTADSYYCRIHLPHEEWTAEWKMQGRNEWKSSCIVTECHSWFQSQIKHSISAVGHHEYGWCRRMRLPL